MEAAAIGGAMRVGEEIRAGALAQQVDHWLAGAGVATASAAESLAEGAGDDVDPIHDRAVLVGAAAILADETDGVGIIDHDHRVILVSQIADRPEIGDRAIH